MVEIDVARADAMLSAETAAIILRRGSEDRLTGTVRDQRVKRSGRLGPDQVEVESAVTDVPEIVQDQLWRNPR